MNRELVFLRTYALATAVGVILIAIYALSGKPGSQQFTEIDVERINIVEKDGTVKMIITNVERFPTGSDSINERPTNESRKKRSGMLFFNEDGIECGGFIFDGQRTESGHSSGLSLTYDKYDGDQVMQLLTQDYQEGDERTVRTTLTFIDRPVNETQLRLFEIAKELDYLAETDPEAMQEKYLEYNEQGLLGAVPRIILGQSRSQKNGLFLFDDQGVSRAMFYVDKENRAKLDFFDEQGNIIL